MRRNRTTRIFALAALALLLLSGLGLAASAVESHALDDGRVGAPRQGDVFAYRSRDGREVALSWNGTGALHDEWGRAMDVDWLEVAAPESAHALGYRGGEQLARVYDNRGAGGGGGSAGGGSSGSPNVGGSDRADVEMRSAARWFGERPALDIPCLERAGWQGARIGDVAARAPGELCAAWAGAYAEVRAAGAEEVDGLLARRFVIGTNDQAALVLWLAPDVPYPLAMGECAWTCPSAADASWRLVGYRGGGAPLLPAAPPLAPPAPPSLAPLVDGLPRDGRSEFPAREALAAIEADAELTEHQEFRARHPDARPFLAMHVVDVNTYGAPDETEEWGFAWAAGDEEGSHVRSIEDGDCRAAPPLPMALPPDLARSAGRCRPANTEGTLGCGGCRGIIAPASTMSFDEAISRFEARRVTPDEPLWGYGYDLRAQGDGTTSASITVMAAVYAPSQPQNANLLVGQPGGSGAVNGETVTFDALTGEVLIHQYTANKTITWTHEGGLLDRIVPPATPGGSSTQVAAPVSLAARVPDGVYATSAAVAIAALAALLLARGVAPIVLLYTRLTKRDVLAHPRRGAILGALQRSPGLSQQELEDATAVRGGALRHHLAVLVRAGQLARLESGGYARYFVAGTADHVRFAEETVLLAGGAEARLLHALREEPGLHAAALARKLGVTRPAVHATLRHLADKGLVRETREGVRLRIYART